MKQGPNRNRAKTGPPSSGSRKSRPRSDPSNPMAISSIVNDDNHSERETAPRTRSHSIQLPPLERSLHTSRQRSDPFIYGPCYQSTSSFAVQQAPENPNSPTSSEKSMTIRAPRPKYEIEQIFFIWYHRTDLSLPWDEVLHKYREQFQQSRQKTGLQCKFYRLLDDWGVERVRAQVRNSHRTSNDSVGAYGVIQRTWHRFAWMRPEEMHLAPLLQFRNRGQSRMSSAKGTCTSCSEGDQRYAQRS